ncbi:hypothetical protein [Cupriavidus necator]
MLAFDGVEIEAPPDRAMYEVLLLCQLRKRRDQLAIGHINLIAVATQFQQEINTLKTTKGEESEDFRAELARLILDATERMRQTVKDARSHDSIPKCDAHFILSVLTRT